MSERDRDATRIGARATENGSELFLTIENALEDRVRTYTRRLRLKQLLAKSQSSNTEK